MRTSIKAVIDEAAKLGGWKIVTECDGRFPRQIRRYDSDGGRYCPITSLRPIHNIANYHLAAKELGLTESQGGAIVCAADDMMDSPKHSLIRTYMLKRFGLEESRG